MAESGARGRPPSGQIRKEQSTEAGRAAADCSVVAMTPGNAGRAKGTGHPGVDGGQLPRQEEPPAKPRPKPFAISKQVVWEAYRRVKANDGAGGVDGQSLQEFEQELKNNLYKLWNRMSSGTYFPPPVRAVEIPKKSGTGVRMLGVPTVADRIAQTVAAMYLEPKVEPIFHEDSYGYRPGRSALQALERCRERCWRSDWVIDLDIKNFFDSLPHSLIMRAVEKHTELKWLRLYVERWLKAPVQKADGTLVARNCGSPQGSAISPLLANLFMHYCFDSWMARKFPTNRFERYCDDLVVHCVSKQQAEIVKEAIGQRLKECQLEMHPDKTRIVYCKDGKRRGSHEHVAFTFLGYEFRVRRVKSRAGKHFDGFNPAISPKEAKRLRSEMRLWRLCRWTTKTLHQLAAWVNPKLQGWVNYYGHIYRSALLPILRGLDEHLARWARRKYKRLSNSRDQAYRLLRRVHRHEPTLFAHWRLGVRP
jgi:RNA-directed DNA polymerase